MPRGRKKGSKNKPKTVMAAHPTNPANSANQVSKTNTESNSGNMTIAEAIRRKKNNTTDTEADAKNAIKKAVINVTKGATNDEVDDNDDEVDVDVDVNADNEDNGSMSSDALNDLGYPQNRITPSVRSAISTDKNGSRVFQRPVARCDRCGGPILTAQPYAIDTDTLTALAEWHRDAMPKRVKMCVMCAHELSEIVEKWYLKNPNAKKKAYLER